MPTEMIVNERNMIVELISRESNKHVFRIGDREIEVDIARVGQGNYSILFEGKSYEFEIVPGMEKKKYMVRHRCYNFDVEIVDAESKYLKSRGKGIKGSAENLISSPMPGKVVRVLVAEGDVVKEGQTVIVISAMKMESEYKSGLNGKVKKVYVKEGDTIEGKKVLIELE
jgi:biotin carboxyl carrier protein